MYSFDMEGFVGILNMICALFSKVIKSANRWDCLFFRQLVLHFAYCFMIDNSMENCFVLFSLWLLRGLLLLFATELLTP